MGEYTEKQAMGGIGLKDVIQFLIDNREDEGKCAKLLQLILTMERAQSGVEIAEHILDCKDSDEAFAAVMGLMGASAQVNNAKVRELMVMFGHDTTELDEKLAQEDMSLAQLLEEEQQKKEDADLGDNIMPFPKPKKPTLH